MSSPLGSVLGSIQKGIILLLLGVGFIGGSAAIASQAAAAVGMVLGFVGLGFLVSAGVTRRLSRKWGLLEKPGK